MEGMDGDIHGRFRKLEFDDASAGSLINKDGSDDQQDEGRRELMWVVHALGPLLVVREGERERKGKGRREREKEKKEERENEKEGKRERGSGPIPSQNNAGLIPFFSETALQSDSISLIITQSQGRLPPTKCHEPYLDHANVCAAEVGP
jgi:hypothetical protein